MTFNTDLAEFFEEYDEDLSWCAVARASQCMRRAVQPCNSQLSFVHEHALREWSMTKAAHSGLQSTAYLQPSGDRQYCPIGNPFEIRVLELRPGTPGSSIESALHHCSIEFESTFHAKPGAVFEDTRYATSLTDPAEPTWYTALSYTWGKPVFDKIIRVNGSDLKITTSLYTALLHIRHAEHSVILWVDQICIDQSNVKEKEQQIPLMSRIYRHALNTFIWLGEPPRPEVNPFHALARCAVNLYMTTNVDCPKDFTQLGLPESESDEWDDIWRFLSNLWFTRLWIIQEFCLSRHLQLACGPYRSSWKVITDASTRLEDSGISHWLLERFAPERENCVTVFDYISYLDFNKSLPKALGVPLDFLYQLVSTRPSMSQQPRDKVYGVLGFELGVRDGFSGKIKPNYDDSYTAAELFYDAAVDIVTCGKAARSHISNLLCAVDHSHESTLPGLPSWVPDWTKPRQTRSILSYNSGHFDEGMYASCGKSRMKYTSDMILHADLKKHGFSLVTQENGNPSRTLCMKGKFVDTIEDATDPMQHPDITWEKPEPREMTLLACWTLVNSVKIYPGRATTVFEAFWRTLVANRDGSFKAHAPEAYAEIFSLLLDATTGFSIRKPSLMGQTYSARQQRPEGRGRLELVNLAVRQPGETFQAIRSIFRGLLENRRFGVTKTGYFGLFPGHARVGDAVCTFSQVTVPMVVRETHTGVKLVGECYIHGIMQGEFMDNEEIAMKTFHIT